MGATRIDVVVNLWFLLLLTASPSASSSSSTSVLSKEEAFPLVKEQGESIADVYYHIAKQMSKEENGAQGQTLGWLYLLAALEFSPSNSTLLEPVIESYVRSGDVALALAHTKAALSAVVRAEKTGGKFDKKGGTLAQGYLTSIQRIPKAKHLFKDSPKFKEATEGHIPAPKLTLPFSTVIARWDLYDAYTGIDKEVSGDLYGSIIRAYNIFKSGVSAAAANGAKSSDDTQLNHDFYDWQMQPLKATGKYWKGFEDLPIFHRLLRIFRSAAARFLVSCGLSQSDAELKARSRTVVWASVHTGASTHGPHNTEDSMVGGVFYVKVPPQSGSLVFSDPRGKNSVMQSPAHVPTPPFHTLYQVDPYEGLMIMFPGWLVHQVAPSNGLNPQASGYRVSISYNLNGEWAETTPAIFDHVVVGAGGEDKDDREHQKKTTMDGNAPPDAKHQPKTEL